MPDRRSDTMKRYEPIGTSSPRWMARAGDAVLVGMRAVSRTPALACDQLVHVGPLELAEVAIVNEPAVVRAEEAQKRPVSLAVHPLRQPVGQLSAKLRVVRGQQHGDIGIWHGAEHSRLEPQTRSRNELLFPCEAPEFATLVQGSIRSTSPVPIEML
jgi:hypothetical protein